MRISTFRKVLIYRPRTGEFVWRKRRGHKNWNTRFAGKVAGWVDDYGYVVIDVGCSRTKAHRLAFAFMRGFWPYEVDHRNGVRSDNRWANLRVASRTQNNANAKLRVNNTSGYKGVSFDRKTKKWRAHFRVHGRRFHCPRRADIEQARRDYIRLAIKHFGEFARP